MSESASTAAFRKEFLANLPPRFRPPQFEGDEYALAAKVTAEGKRGTVWLYGEELARFGKTPAGWRLLRFGGVRAR
jgi:hypothetical protein